MRKNYKIYLAALLLVGAVGMMTARAQGSGNKPTLAVFVVGMDNTLGNSLAQQIGAELNRNSRYDVLPSTNNAVSNKLAELRTQNASSIDRNALAEWGRTNGISTICLVTDAIKGSDHMFYALLIDTKDSKVSGRGSYIRTGVVSTDLPRVSLALSRQLDDPGRRRSAPAPTRSYPAELDIEMVRVEGGTFTMGCIPERDGTCQSNELPAHSVTVSSFYIGKYTVTRAQWSAAMAGHPTLANPGLTTRDNQVPIDRIHWRDIDTAFLPRLRKLTGKQYRLPTEAEWEFAARGGIAKTNNMYSGSNSIDEVAWYLSNAGNTIHPVGQKNPNELGIYDMSGNLWEWCSDWYDANHYANVQKGIADPLQGPNSGTTRVVRGGDWPCTITVPYLRNASRYGYNPGEYQDRRGFRLALPAQ
jgi:formylglycine-generating enzyme required for sulfatase activity